MFTAKAQDEDLGLAGQLGASAYITKPFDPKTLIARIKELIGS
jgi:DNA-binding response OmpR family regulator